MVRSLTLSVSDLEEPLQTKHDKDEIPDKIKLMMRQEENDYKCFDYLIVNADVRKKAAKPVDEECRVKMVEWCVQVVDFCKFRRETVGIGMSYLDRYLCADTGKKALSDRKEYQLVAMTCLYIAIKLHEPLEMETSLLADLSRGCYTEMEFANMEQKILQALKWRVSGPTALGFVLHFMLFLPDSVHSAVANAIFDYARYQTEMAVADHTFVKTKPSLVGLAALLNAMEGMDSSLLTRKQESKFRRAIIKNIGIDLEEVEECQYRLSNTMLGILSKDEIAQMEKELQDEEDRMYEERLKESEEEES